MPGTVTSDLAGSAVDNGGFMTGSGWITLPAGDYPADPGATGRANFDFVSKYKQGASMPTGSTELQFKARAGDTAMRTRSSPWWPRRP
ncbi:hypothetical protein [Streptomyces vietnamensis]|uniref:Uncharacterized protein n=1 Tax=Streptomyces vietnamensis TaxID=362257 RepID=A0A0B5IFX4_9ACTN|nr:hypothetical protein [Streptomyces vietnamensis]AJF68603.1 hypothetical protein SVTN_33980 [Streptomyces vietnamensis]